jgi:excisionase family DNA binding protein
MSEYYTAGAALMTVRQAAEVANVSPATIRRRIHEGLLPAITVGVNAHAPVRIAAADLDRFLYDDAPE